MSSTTAPVHGAPPDSGPPDETTQRCLRCSGRSNDPRHDSLMHCNTYSHRAGRGPCPRPSDHHAYQPSRLRVW